MWKPNESVPVEKPKGLGIIWGLGGLVVAAAIGNITTYVLLNGTSDFGWADVMSYLAVALGAPIVSIAGAICTFVCVRSASGVVHSTVAFAVLRAGLVFWVAGKFGYRLKGYFRKKNVLREQAVARLELKEKQAKQEADAHQRDREEVANFENSYKAGLSAIVPVIRGMESTLNGARRSIGILTGSDMPSAQEMLTVDITCLFGKLSECFQSVPFNLVAYCLFILQTIEPSENLTLSETSKRMTYMRDAAQLELPGAVSALALVDEHLRSDASALAAQLYLAIAKTAVELCPHSTAAEVLLSVYGQLLMPYAESRASEDAGHSTGGKEQSSCPKCVDGYRVLDLPLGSSWSLVDDRRLGLTEVLHPDRLGSKSERARFAAEQQLKNINQASDHIRNCPLAARA